jgi:hypothetical protein
VLVIPPQAARQSPPAEAEKAAEVLV